MADVAVVSVAVSGAVALGTVLINGRLAAWQSKRVARDSQLDELRSVFDAAAIALMEFMHSVPTEELDYHHPDGPERQLPAMYGALKRVREQEARIGVRLGAEKELFKAYASVRGCAESYTEYYQLRRGLEKWVYAEVLPFAERQDAANGKFFNLAAARIGPDRK